MEMHNLLSNKNSPTDEQCRSYKTHWPYISSSFANSPLCSVFSTTLSNLSPPRFSGYLAYPLILETVMGSRFGQPMTILSNSSSFPFGLVSIYLMRSDERKVESQMLH